MTTTADFASEGIRAFIRALVHGTSTGRVCWDDRKPVGLRHSDKVRKAHSTVLGGSLLMLVQFEEHGPYLPSPHLVVGKAPGAAVGAGGEVDVCCIGGPGLFEAEISVLWLAVRGLKLGNLARAAREPPRADGLDDKLQCTEPPDKANTWHLQMGTEVWGVETYAGSDRIPWKICLRPRTDSQQHAIALRIARDEDAGTTLVDPRVVLDTTRELLGASGLTIVAKDAAAEQDERAVHAIYQGLVDKVLKTL